MKLKLVAEKKINDTKYNYLKIQTSVKTCNFRLIQIV